jgi:ferredoxin
VVKDYDACQACFECVRRCQFAAHAFDKDKDAKPVYHRERCVGCGACGMGCPSGALHLEPLPDEEWFHVPSSFAGWEEERIRQLEAGKAEA